ncbi:twin-arginine translocase subunit TatC [Alicyclobacillus acidiphilus]|uniref:twin-arginine translocase subunit TatC n=1 Tax=Alicyclobacillus acidiphilus TaxID=182455 RepID=UPI000832652D|nr:twin-arginine translocase subunit TatC [Alicyclobacillus acidiphilus]
MPEGWTEHMAELRLRVIFVFGVFAASLIAGFFFAHRLYRSLVMPGVKLVILGPGDVVHVYLLLAGSAAVAVTFPIALWQCWIFISPALTPRARSVGTKLMFVLPAVFAGGACFGYFVIFPNIYRFLIHLAVGYGLNPLITANEYFGFLVGIVLPFAVIFELPILLMVLVELDLITPKWMASVRKYAYLVCVVFATLISPPELVSHLSVLVPLLLIYEISVSLCTLVYRRKLRRGSSERVVTGDPSIT